MILFRLNESGKANLCPYGITNGSRTIPCDSEEYANNLLRLSRFEGYTVIESDEVSEKLTQTLKGVRFDTLEDAESFINGGGYEDSILSRVEDIELTIAEMIGG